MKPNLLASYILQSIKSNVISPLYPSTLDLNESNVYDVNYMISYSNLNDASRNLHGIYKTWLAAVACVSACKLPLHVYVNGTSGTIYRADIYITVFKTVILVPVWKCSHT